MSVSFGGIPSAGIDFLSDLAANNTKDWFQSHRKVYEKELREPMLELVETLSHELNDFAPEYAVEKPFKALSRINRDTRFGTDKTPYNTRMSAVLPRGGAKKSDVAGFFFGISPSGVDTLGGAYMPGPPQLAALRASWASAPETFRSLTEDKELRRLMGELQGEQLKRVPRGYPAEHPAADLLRYKQVYFRQVLEPEIASTAQLLPALVERFRALTPFVRLLDEAMAAAAAK